MSGSEQPASILVLRALDLGDMLCATPALRALRLGFPRARITLCGAPWAEALLPHLGPLVDEFLPFPGDPLLPERCGQTAEVEAFWSRVGERRWDLALQMHGSGEVTNGIVRRFPAKEYGGLRRDSAPAPGRWFVDWRDGIHEIEQLLRVTDTLGLARDGVGLTFEETPADRLELGSIASAYGLRPGDYAVIHPGAKWESRRWPAERFAAVAKALAREGPVVLTGVAAERGLADSVRELAGGGPVNMAGETTLGGFAAVLRRARVVVTNDTGASHLAVAVRTPSVTVSAGSDVSRWAPLDRSKHAVLWRDADCRPCMFERCPYSQECCDVSPGEVLSALRRLGRTALYRRPSPIL